MKLRKPKTQYDAKKSSVIAGSQKHNVYHKKEPKVLNELAKLIGIKDKIV